MTLRFGGRVAHVPLSILLAVTLAGCGESSTSSVSQDVPAPLAKIAVTPATATVVVNTTQQFTAAGSDAQGAAISITPSWTLANGGGTIDANGLFKAGTVPGTYANTIVARSGTITGTASITVVAGPVKTIGVAPAQITMVSGTTQQFTVQAWDEFGNVTTGTAQWSVVAGGGTIDANGLFTAGAAGSYANTVQVAVGSLTARATVIVVAGAAASIEIAPTTVTLVPGATQQFTVTAKDAVGNGTPVAGTWSVVGGGGTIDAATGGFTAGTTAGTYTNTVKVTVGSLSATATVIVTPAGAASVAIDPPTAVTLAVDQQHQFSAHATDVHGNAVPFTGRWSVSTNGGAIDASGNYTAGQKAGTYTITATLAGASATATVTVTPGALKTLIVEPATIAVPAGTTYQFSVIGADAYSNVIPAFATFSLDNGGGTMGQLGLFTAGGNLGTYTVRATANNMSSTATVIVVPGPVATLVIAPDNPTVRVGKTQQFTVTARDAFNNLTSATSTWSVVAGGGVIDASTGLFTAGITTGTFTNTIRAAAGSVVDVASVTVTPPTSLDRADPFAIVAHSLTLPAGYVGTAIYGSVGLVGEAQQSYVTGHLTGDIYVNNATAQGAATDGYLYVAWADGLACGATQATVSGTITPGKYCYSGTMQVWNVTLDAGGDPNAVFVISAGTINIGSSLTNATITLANGAQADKVIFIGNVSVLGSGSVVRGIIGGGQADLQGGSLTGHVFTQGPVTFYDAFKVYLP